MRATPKDALFSLLSTILVIVSVFVPKEIKTVNEAADVPLGLPLPFINQDLSHRFQSSQGNFSSAQALATPDPQPVRLGLHLPNENPFTTFTGWCYLLNIAIFFGSFRLLDFLILDFLLTKTRKS
jgi:hypothetical protein